MANINFDINLNSNIDKKLKMAIENAKKLETQFNKVRKSMQNVEKSYKTLGKPIKLNVNSSDIDKAAAKINKLKKDINKPASGQGGGMFGGLGGLLKGGLILGGAMKLGSMVKDTIMDSINASMQNEMTNKSFEILTGDAEVGKNLTRQLRHLKESTILGAGIYKNAQTMLGFGIDQRDVINNLKELGNIAMGDAERLNSLTLAFSQVSAAGKLTGQDLLQFINAGFNPLQIMSERWKEFGFNSKKSIGDLRELVSKGAISSNMVAKAFELATSEGGKFYQMMDKIGQTSYGRLQQLKGQWAGMKIDIGNALTPMTNAFLSAGLSAMKFLHISADATEKIIQEKTEVNYLVGKLAELEKGNEKRAYYIDLINSKYPEFLKGIDLEKVSNEDLAKALANVNKEYAKKAKYSMMDARMSYLEEKKNIAKIKIQEDLDMIARAEYDSAYRKRKLFFNPQIFKIKQKEVEDLLKEVKDYEKLQFNLNPIKKANEAEQLQDAVKKAIGLSPTEAEAKFGSGYKKVQKQLSSLLPNLTQNMPGYGLPNTLPSALSFVSPNMPQSKTVINEEVRKKLEELLNTRPNIGGGSTDPNSKIGAGKTRVVGQQNKTYNIIINDGLINKLENHYEVFDGEEVSADVQASIIKGITDALNALPNYNK